MAAGTMRPSQILRKLAAYPRQNELAAALREVGRIECSLCSCSTGPPTPDMRRRAQVGLNKGEAHHALKRNLLAAIIIYWNTQKLSEGRLRQVEGRPREHAHPHGGQVPFSQVAVVEPGRVFASLRRVDRNRAVNVTASIDPSATSAGDVIADLNARPSRGAGPLPRHVPYVRGGDGRTAGRSRRPCSADSCSRC